jgi:crotonobetainyl-CoA:carnitine CoA-transferase CaiB-like acyl-CoA transferase
VFEGLCAALDRPEIASDPRFADNRTRLEHADALDEMIRAEIAQRDLEPLLAVCEQHGAALAPVYSVADTFVDAQYRARDNVIAVADDELGTLRFQNVVGRLSLTPGGVDRPGPRLGEHNVEVLVERLGFDRAELAAAGLPLGAGATA